MKNRTMLIATAFVVAAAGLAYADKDDRPGSDWMSVSQVTIRLESLGFTRITKIEADDGMWEAKGYKNGGLVKVKLDPRSGEVVSEKSKKKDDDDD